MSTKIENAHNLHRELSKLISEVEIDQEWIDDTCVKCKITSYNVNSLRDSIIDKITDFVNDNYTLHP